MRKRLIEDEQQLVKRQTEYRELLQQKKDVEERLQKNAIKLPESSELPAFFQHLETQAATANVRIVSRALDKEVPVENYVKVPVKLEVQGDFYQINNYFKLLSETTRIITIENLSIGAPATRRERPRDADGEVHRVDVPPVRPHQGGGGGGRGGRQARRTCARRRRRPAHRLRPPRPRPRPRERSDTMKRLVLMLSGGGRRLRRRCAAGAEGQGRPGAGAPTANKNAEKTGVLLLKPKVDKQYRKELAPSDFQPDPTGDINRDPFESYLVAPQPNGPQTPVQDECEDHKVAEKYAYNDLKLIGIVIRGTRNFAMFRDPHADGADRLPGVLFVQGEGAGHRDHAELRAHRDPRRGASRGARSPGARGQALPASERH